MLRLEMWSTKIDVFTSLLDLTLEGIAGEGARLEYVEKRQC